MARKATEQYEAVVWKNKIIRTEEVEIEQVLANPNQWKVHSQFAQQALEGSLDDLGILKPLIINLRTSSLWPPGDKDVHTLLDGHRRCVVAMRRGQTTWPANYVDLTPDEENEALLIIDEITGLRTPDTALLASLMRDVSTPSVALQQMLDALAQEHGIVPRAAPDAPEAFPSYDENLPTEHICPRCGYAFSGGDTREAAQ